MDQTKKATIAAALKAIPEIKDWKYSLKVSNHSTITMTVQRGPIELFHHFDAKHGYEQVNLYSIERAFEGDLLETVKKIRAALNTGNWDRSDVQSDYFDVGHYVHFHLGSWDKPFEPII